MNNAMTVETHSPEETERLGRILGEVVPLGALVALSGELAAGKTCLVRGMAAWYATGENVSSPTFTIVNEYGRTPRLYHVDLYRLDHPRQLADLGYEDLMDPVDGVCVIEWAERAEGYLPARRLDVTLEHVDEEVRRIRIHDVGVMPVGWQDRLAAYRAPA